MVSPISWEADVFLCISLFAYLNGMKAAWLTSDSHFFHENKKTLGSSASKANEMMIGCMNESKSASEREPNDFLLD